MYIDESNIDHEAATDRDPGTPYPLDLDITVNQNVKVRISVFLELQDANVLQGSAMMALQVNPQFGKRRVQVANGITFNLLWVERQGYESGELQSLGSNSNRALVALRSPGTAV